MTEGNVLMDYSTSWPPSQEEYDPDYEVSSMESDPCAQEDTRGKWKHKECYSESWNDKTLLQLASSGRFGSFSSSDSLDQEKSVRDQNISQLMGRCHLNRPLVEDAMFIMGPGGDADITYKSVNGLAGSYATPYSDSNISQKILTWATY